MLRLSKMADYAVMVLGMLAQDQSPDIAQSGAQLAIRTGLSEPTVAKVLKLLARQNIVTSMRGQAGGYRLSNAPDQISVLSIVEAIDGPVQFTDCTDGHDGCSLHLNCTVKGQWDPVANAIKASLKNVSLAEMILRTPAIQVASA